MPPSDREIAIRAIACLDLTDLSDRPTDTGTDELCRKAVQGGVAAVCVWPRFISRARERLAGTTVAIATVVNFPAGDEDVERVIDGTQEALSDGATEIDLVLPYRALWANRTDRVHAMVHAVRDVVHTGRLKVILETGSLDPATIAAASRLAIAERADFLKTSTGKSPVSATPEAAEIMLHAIKESGRPVGLKVSGGLRTLADARLYLELADRIMGPGWATPATFRIGASSLYDALAAARDGAV